MQVIAVTLVGPGNNPEVLTYQPPSGGLGVEHINVLTLALNHQGVQDYPPLTHL